MRVQGILEYQEKEYLVNGKYFLENTNDKRSRFSLITVVGIALRLEEFRIHVNIIIYMFTKSDVNNQVKVAYFSCINLLTKIKTINVEIGL